MGTIMTSDKLQSIYSELAETPVPDLAGVTLADIVQLQETSSGLQALLRLGVYNPALCANLEQCLADIVACQGAEVTTTWVVDVPGSSRATATASLESVKNIVAVASGKGGVGKSTTSVNLALALAADGAKVGLLDADIYGPSQPHMLGVGDQRPQMHAANVMTPIDTQGIKLLSMGNLVTEKTPMVWRGPMASGALQQLLNNTHWGELDYLVVDMPPGTGDIQLTLSQSVPLAGAVVVTTPQDIALLDAKKGIEMFTKVDVPVLGVVENMSTHTCSNCGHTEAIFGEHGGDQLATEYGVGLLGRLPLAMSIRSQTDSGRPPVAAEPESAVAAEYFSIARKVALSLWQLAANASNAGPMISITDD
ncbi:iron-sulfur cluster carrier protein ApbC [Teredinibacter turnerae]|uniref:iron-sulfur cluster carrier protein ApbC n=1 Tax=Teredinibacter turnerae TaxID=2426 RepID=UPI00036A25CA|nr:iron-sulfur cluster carrier protein ApbC [Teredinibacter turnerae]